MTEINNNILNSLINLSNKIEFELSLSDEEKANYESTLIDKLVENGYSLHFYRFPNFQILSTICSGNTKDGYIPVKSVITSDIKTGFITLNESLKIIPQDKFIFNFKNEIHNHEESVRECQKTLNKYHY